MIHNTKYKVYVFSFFRYSRQIYKKIFCTSLVKHKLLLNHNVVQKTKQFFWGFLLKIYKELNVLLFIFVYGLQDQCQKFFAHSLCVVVKYFFTAKIFKTTTHKKTGLTIFQELLPIFCCFVYLPIHFISFLFFTQHIFYLP